MRRLESAVKVLGSLLALPATVMGILALSLWGDAGNWPWIVAAAALVAGTAARRPE